MIDNRPTATETRVQQISLPVDYSIATQTGGVLGTVIAVVTAILWVRRRFSRDGLEVTKDRMEGSLLSILLKERDEALKAAAAAWSQRTADAQKISKLQAEVDNLTTENQRMVNQMVQLESNVKKLSKILAEVAPAEVKKFFGD